MNAIGFVEISGRLFPFAGDLVITTRGPIPRALVDISHEAPDFAEVEATETYLAIMAGRVDLETGVTLGELTAALRAFLGRPVTLGAVYAACITSPGVELREGLTAASTQTNLPIDLLEAHLKFADLRDELVSALRKFGNDPAEGELWTH